MKRICVDPMMLTCRYIPCKVLCDRWFNFMILKLMQAIKRQFPEEDSYILNTSNRLTFTDFPARLQFILEDNDGCTVIMDQAEVNAWTI